MNPRRRDGERGLALVEMALALPIFLLLVIGTMDLGRAVFVRNLAAHAAREGARFASLDPANAGCVRTVASRNSGFANLTTGNVTYTPPGSLAIGQPVTVTVASDFQPLTPLVRGAMGVNGLRLSAAATVRIRNVPAASLGCG